MKMKQVILASRFNGPPHSGNGGYSCGALAAFIPGPSSIRLHQPPPLDTVLEVFETDAGRVEMRDGDTLVGSGVATTLELDIPAPPSLDQAVEASKGYLYYENHQYPTCFVCGPKRPGEDGLCIYPGPVDNWELLACPWLPGQDLLDESGYVRPEIVWAALDCPGCFAAVGDSMPPVLLGELTADLRHPVPGAEPLVVFCWPMGREGRKLYGGVAIANREGDILACSKSTWIHLQR